MAGSRSIRGWRGLSLLVLAFSAVAAQADSPRFAPVDRLLGGRADWLSSFDDRIAFGSGHSVVLARRGAFLRVEAEIRLDRPIVEGVLSWNRLYLNDGTTIHELDLNAPVPLEVPLQLTPRPRGALHLARHGDNLVVAEDGVGLRLIRLPLPPEHDDIEHRHGFPDEPTQISLLAMERSFTALTSFTHRIYAAVDGPGLAVVDGFDLERPEQLREFALSDPVHSIGVNGSRLYLLGEAGLRILDIPEGGEARVEGLYPAVRGRSIQLTGRTMHVAGGDAGVLTLRDTTPLATTHTVTIQGITFNPANITIDPGDTVQWVHSGGLPHNVESCDGVADPVQCSGTAVEGQFVTPFPMPATGSAFTVSHTFTVPGANPYFCVVHVASGMVGTVQVNAPAPPGVPSGLSGTPLLVEKVAGFPDGSRLALTYDNTTCTGNTDHQILHSLGSRLPAFLGGTYFLVGAVCNIGSTGSFLWDGVPSGIASDPLVWFLVLSENDGGVEGSWGTDSSGTERDGFGPAGSSGQCGITTKGLSNGCGSP